MTLILKLLSSPISWLAILAGVVFFLHQSNQNLNLKLDASQGVIERLEKNVKQLNDNVIIVQGDQQRFEQLMVKKGDLRKSQDSINERLSAIPDTSTCRPFQDTNTLDAARQFRDYQVH